MLLPIVAAFWLHLRLIRVHLSMNEEDLAKKEFPMAASFLHLYFPSFLDDQENYPFLPCLKIQCNVTRIFGAGCAGRSWKSQGSSFGRVWFYNSSFLLLDLSVLILQFSQQWHVLFASCLFCKIKGVIFSSRWHIWKRSLGKVSLMA